MVLKTRYLTFLVDKDKRLLHQSPLLFTTKGSFCGSFGETLKQFHSEMSKAYLYSRCQLGMTPQQFYAKWQVSQEVIALICQRSSSTVQRWFSRGQHYRRPTPADMRYLALVDFLLEHFSEIPAPLLMRICAIDLEQF